MAATERIASHFPHFFQTEDYSNVFYQFISIFGAAVDATEDDLLRIMRSHWVDKANNELPATGGIAPKGDLDKLFALYLEKLGGTALLRQLGRRPGEEGLEDDALYRKRIKAIIRVLMEGASNREGIIEIIAANLGITGDNPEAVTARNQIELIEYLPDYTPTVFTGLKLYETFEVFNPSPEPTATDIKIDVSTLGSFPLRNLSIYNLDTGFNIEFAPAVTIQDNDQIIIQSDGTATKNGITISLLNIIYTNGLPVIPSGTSQWQIRSLTGQFDYTDFSTYRNHRFYKPVDPNPEVIYATDEKLFNVEMIFEKIHPATFMVLIPWDIPGFTEIFDQLGGDPRLQILDIVNRVKAAGVLAVVSFQKTFAENHATSSSFSASDSDRTYTTDQEMLDGGLLFGGVFDGTGYDYSFFN